MNDVEEGARRNDSYRLPPGHQPYDPLIGLRIGALAGGVIGILASVVIGTVWVAVAGAVIGGAVGYRVVRRNHR